jgi:RNA polymerase sigma-70 factor (ECF subfamily)
LNSLEETSAIRHCQAGDKEAFRALAEEHERMLFGIAYLMTRDRDLAADAVQESFLKAWKHMPSLHSENGLKAWLVRIVVNEVKQQGRKRQAPTVPIEQASELADGADGIEIVMERDELRESVRRAVRTLPDRQRETVGQRYYGQLTMAEIAAAMGCRKGTVKSRLNRALGRLEDILNGDMVIDLREEVDR